MYTYIETDVIMLRLKRKNKFEERKKEMKYDRKV